MTPRRKLFLWLLVIPIIIVMLIVIWPVSSSDQHNGIELLFLIFGLPVFILNFLEWYAPQILDEIFGRPAEKLSPGIEPSQPDGAWLKTAQFSRPGWLLIALFAIVLVFGIILGAGSLALINRTPLNSSEPATQTKSSGALKPKGPAENATLTASPRETTIATSTATARISPTATIPLLSPTMTAGNTQTTGCNAPTQIQFDVIRTNIQALDPQNDIKKGYLFKSAEVENLWFFGAKIYGPDFSDGVTDPAVWAFSGPIDSPTDVYAVNDLAFQYSDFVFGPLADPPVEMQSTGAQTVFDCVNAAGE